jgi:autoinducer 2-degrading protein
MLVYVVTVKVKPDCVDRFISATKENHLATRKEPGNRRFDLIQNPADPCDFLLYEVYANDDAVVSHKQTGHYAKWREEVASFMATDRVGVRYLSVWPEGEQQW